MRSEHETNIVKSNIRPEAKCCSRVTMALAFLHDNPETELFRFVRALNEDPEKIEWDNTQGIFVTSDNFPDVYDQTSAERFADLDVVHRPLNPVPKTPNSLSAKLRSLGAIVSLGLK